MTLSQAINKAIENGHSSKIQMVGAHKAKDVKSFDASWCDKEFEYNNYGSYSEIVSSDYTAFQVW